MLARVVSTVIAVGPVNALVRMMSRVKAAPGRRRMPPYRLFVNELNRSVISLVVPALGTMLLIAQVVPPLVET